MQTEIGQRTLERHESDALDNHVAPGIGQDLFLDPVATINGGIPNSIRRNAGLHLGDLGACVPLFLREVRLPIRHDEAEIASAGVVDARVVDLIQNPVAQREPDTALSTDGRAHATLCARRPPSGKTRPARGERLRVFSHARPPPLGAECIATRPLVIRVVTMETVTERPD